MPIMAELAELAFPARLSPMMLVPILKDASLTTAARMLDATQTSPSHGLYAYNMA
eukprot:CAMPEP_0115718560 /NCGR_PEP_ID=MMETSP0272-20121206/77491_1 /TAXON_ID=71861 /ORGANISM="Scrippsiella trochoidea, Strain CCMP3099" /LENGTH=54 /DNA_ID=CAMNT_0003161087 /DNA_START=212 /DNA_END=376 /DNA_ORIENTATION=+